MQSIPRALRRALVGKPIHNERLGDAVLPKRTALPVFSADALSSVAYAPDEIILTLALAGTTAVAVSPLVGLAVLVVLAVVITAYRQNVRAYPSGGGDYEIVSKNLGRAAGVGVGAALMADYVLVVAVSMATAAQYVTAALPALADRRVELAVGGILLVGLLNLRGLAFMGRAAAVPTYFFLAVLTALILVGVGRDLAGSLGTAPSAAYEVLPAAGFDAGLAGLAGALLVLRAFSSGAVALTGVETITNSVPYFRKPRAVNAAATLGLLGALAAALLAGVMYLADRAGVVVVGDPAEQLLIDGRHPAPDFFQDPVLGQLARTVFGPESLWFFVLVAATVGVLVLAANTAFSGFPTLASRLARDAFLPRQLQARGDRYAFTNGIVLLLLVAVVLTVAFGANVNRLIQLYIVGVFVSFTLTQAGMLRHWARVGRLRRHHGDRRELLVRRAVALVAFVQCAAVLVVVLVTKLTQGAWITIVALAALGAVMWGIRRHYDAVDAELALEPDSPVRALPSRVHAIIYVSSVRKPLMRALAYARASRPSTLEAVVVDTNAAATQRILAEWQRLEIPVPVTVLNSPYRDTIGPLVDHVRGVRRKSPRDLVVVYLPEYVVHRRWERLLHNQAIRPLRARLHQERGVMTASVPWHLSTAAGRDVGPESATAPADRPAGPDEKAFRP
ncbi:APC family permease [Kocuria rosea]|uniref:APC family permease n=1 Tax=Kocuria rosea TaxID=1275 RepID=UPI00203FDB52|nr:APC family permease [Kocuria rosea]MCM3687272.1 APC family permease [Kocuria rosea]HST72202.1 APC family permease [Kocuria rosea]